MSPPAESVDAAQTLVRWRAMQLVARTQAAAAATMAKVAAHLCLGQEAQGAAHLIHHIKVANARS
eukprot:7379111-Prymnesium_polylepis.3